MGVDFFFFYLHGSFKIELIVFPISNLLPWNLTFFCFFPLFIDFFLPFAFLPNDSIDSVMLKIVLNALIHLMGVEIFIRSK